MRKAMTFLGELCQKNEDNKLTIILHGGEPTLISPSIYEEAFQVLKEKYSQLKLEILMQTNGVYFTEEMFRFIDKWEIGVGISIDGSLENHNGNRRDIHGNGTFERIAENIRKLQKRNISVSGLIVLTQKLFQQDLEYLKFFDGEDIHIKINPILNMGEAKNTEELLLKPGEYSQYIIRVFEYILKENLSISVSPIDEFIRSAVKEGSLSSCKFQKNCHRNFLAIDSMGDIYPCGKYADIHMCKLGTIEDSPNVVRKNLHNFISKEVVLSKQCRMCKYFEKCHGGCSFEMRLNYGSSIPGSCYCDTQILFEYFESQGLVYFREALLKRREEIQKAMCLLEQEVCI